MQTKPLLYGLIGFFIGGFIVAVAATTVNKPSNSLTASSTPAMMDQMADVLTNKTGDDFDQAFISNMIIHHEGAVAMAKMAQSQSKHDEIKTLSKNIIAAQEKEISSMKQWQMDWGYPTTADHSMMGH
jgi:uncharacterized protein (DUF305 family)